jgi:hypothetical protein
LLQSKALRSGWSKLNLMVWGWSSLLVPKHIHFIKHEISMTMNSQTTPANLSPCKILHCPGKLVMLNAYSVNWLTWWKIIYFLPNNANWELNLHMITNLLIRVKITWPKFLDDPNLQSHAKGSKNVSRSHGKWPDQNYTWERMQVQETSDHIYTQNYMYDRLKSYS